MTTDESAPCGCRRVKAGERWHQVVWCPAHQGFGGCPGPWSASVIEPIEDDDFADVGCYDEDDDGDEIEEALEQCGQTGSGWQSCQMAGTEYCDFECPYRDTDLGPV